MASGFFNMMADLAKQPKKLEKFKNSPDEVMDQYGLSTQQKRLLKSALKGKQHDFHKVVGDESHDHFGDKLDGNVCC